MLCAPTPLLKPVSGHHKRKILHKKYLHRLPFREIAKAVGAAALHGVAARGARMQESRRESKKCSRATLNSLFPSPVSPISQNCCDVARGGRSRWFNQIHKPSPNGAESAQIGTDRHRSAQMYGVSTRKPVVAGRTTTMSSSFHFSPRLARRQTPTDDRRIQRGTILTPVRFSESEAPDLISTRCTP